MKKTILVIFWIVILIFIVWLAGFYYKNFRGARNAFEIPSEDIAAMITAQKSPLQVPQGFELSIFADKLVNPRVLVFDPNGTLVVSVTSEGKILALSAENSEGKADVITLASGLNKPHGLAFYCKTECNLYVAETDSVSMFDYDQTALKISNKRKIISLPTGGQHFTRTLQILSSAVGDRLLIALGSDCNVCNENDWRRASILVANMDGSGLETFASGLRNSVFMALQPNTGQIFATENGRDLLEDNIPPDEINLIREGNNYGWPICYGKNIHDANFDKNVYIVDPCLGKTASYINIQAHSAPLGLAFAPSTWPAEYKNNLFVAFHGSWNRAVPTGYKIVRFILGENGRLSGVAPQQIDFVSGWLKSDGSVLGRPVGIAFNTKGDMFVSDDKIGVIYRITPPK